MTRTLADRLSQARAQSFVGRQRELAVFERLLATPEEPAVVVVSGPPGIGKSTLLRRYADQAADAGADCHWIDARDLPPTIEAIGYRLQPVLARSGTTERRPVVLIDSYELLAGIDATFRDELAPQLPAEVVLVLAGHHPASVGWRTEPGWAAVLQPIRLGNLDDAACSRYLDDRGIPAAAQPAAITFTHGHPLALALVSEVIRDKGGLLPSDEGDVIAQLIERLLQQVPSREHRIALEAAGQVRVVTESLLAALLAVPEAGELFSWMRGLPFVDAGLAGLYLHELARAALDADLRWRHPERYGQFHDRARDYYLGRLDSADPAIASAALLDLIFLHPQLREFLRPPDENAPLQLDRLGSGDPEQITAMITRHEGPESGRIAAHWLAACPQAWHVVRGPDRQAHGALCLLPVEAIPDSDDPAVVAAQTELSRHPPLRPGETATLIRYWLARDSYQNVSPVQSVIATQFARHFLTTPGLAVTLMSFARPEDWAGFCAYADQRRAPEADFVVGGKSYAGFEHDWRVNTPAAWVARLSAQELGAAPPAAAEQQRALVLDEKQFATAVRQALKDYPRPERLRTSQLLGCRLITTKLTGSENLSDKTMLLQSVLKEAVETMTTVPADRRLHRVLVRAYLAPAPTLERAAEVLDLPSSTFRRLLSTAISRVTVLLWHQELDS